MTARILSGATPPEELPACAAELEQLLLEGLDGRALVRDGHGTQLAEGLALSPADAAECVRDTARTTMFLRAVHDAITRSAKARPEVVYAGSGPLAPLLLPILALSERRTVTATILDLHEESVLAVRQLLEFFGLEAAVLQADAVTYTHPVPVDVAITETMQRALTREPQVAITRNLVRQLASDGVLVPERIVIDLVVGDEVVGRVYELDAASARPSPERRLVLAGGAVNGRAQTPALLTTINAGGEHVIAPGESGLTQPEMLWDLSLQTGCAIEFWYETGRSPGMRWRRVPVSSE